MRTIALEEDAPRPLGLGGDDDYLEEDAPKALAFGGDDDPWRTMLRTFRFGGEDDCVGGRCSAGLARQW